MKAETFWDKTAASYAARPLQHLDLHNRTVERSAAYLSPGMRVLEVGCGTGTIAIKLAPHAGHILATDISGNLIDIARNRAAEQGVTNVTFERHDAGALPEGPFDAVLAYNLLHLMEDLNGTIAAMAARLAPGGVLVSKTGVLGDSLPGQLLRPVIGAMRLVGKAPYVGFFSVARLDAAMERHGLQIVEAETMRSSPRVRFLVARKPG